MIEIIKNDTGYSRLTISNQENKLTVNRDCSEFWLGRLKGFSNQVLSDLGDYDRRLRGRFIFYYDCVKLNMEDCHGNMVKSYRFEIEETQ